MSIVDNIKAMSLKLKIYFGATLLSFIFVMIAVGLFTSTIANFDGKVTYAKGSNFNFKDYQAKGYDGTKGVFTDLGKEDEFGGYQIPALYLISPYGTVQAATFGAVVPVFTPVISIVSQMFQVEAGAYFALICGIKSFVDLVPPLKYISTEPFITEMRTFPPTGEAAKEGDPIVPKELKDFYPTLKASYILLLMAQVVSLYPFLPTLASIKGIMGGNMWRKIVIVSTIVAFLLGFVGMIMSSTGTPDTAYGLPFATMKPTECADPKKDRCHMWKLDSSTGQTTEWNMQEEWKYLYHNMYITPHIVGTFFISCIGVFAVIARVDYAMGGVAFMMSMGAALHILHLQLSAPFWKFLDTQECANSIDCVKMRHEGVMGIGGWIQGAGQFILAVCILVQVHLNQVSGDARMAKRRSNYDHLLTENPAIGISLLK